MSPSAADIAVITRFLPIFDSPGFEPGQVVCEDEWSCEIAMPHVDYDEAVSGFMQACHESRWILAEFDWPEWLD